MTKLANVKFIEQQGPLEIHHLKPNLTKVERHEVLRALRVEYAGARISLIGDEIAVSYWSH